MGFFKSLRRDFTKLEKSIGHDFRKLGQVIKKPEVFIPAIVGVVGVIATVATGGLAAPLAAEAEALAIGAVGAEVAVGAVAAEVAAAEFVAVSGAEIVGLSEPLLAEAALAESSAIASSAPIIQEATMLERFGLGGGRAFRAAGQANKYIQKFAPIISLAGTATEIVKGLKEEKLSKKVSILGNVIQGIGTGVEIATGKDLSAIEVLGQQVSILEKGVATIESGISTFQDVSSTTQQTLTDFGLIEQQQNKELSSVERELNDLKSQQHLQQIEEENFENKLLSRVEAEERDILNVVDDLAERLEESFIKDFDFDSMIDLMNRLEQDDIVDFLSRNLNDFNKLSKKEQNIILDLAISKGV